MISNDDHVSAHGTNMVIVGNYRFSIRSFLEKTKTKVIKKSNIMLPGCGVLGCCSRGVPGEYFGAMFRAQGRNDYHPSERL